MESKIDAMMSEINIISESLKDHRRRLGYHNEIKERPVFAFLFNVEDSETEDAIDTVIPFFLETFGYQPAETHKIMICIRRPRPCSGSGKHSTTATRCASRRMPANCLSLLSCSLSTTFMTSYGIQTTIWMRMVDCLQKRIS